VELLFAVPPKNFAQEYFFYFTMQCCARTVYNTAILETGYSSTLLL